MKPLMQACLVEKSPNIYGMQFRHASGEFQHKISLTMKLNFQVIHAIQIVYFLWLPSAVFDGMDSKLYALLTSHGLFENTSICCPVFILYLWWLLDQLMSKHTGNLLLSATTSKRQPSAYQSLKQNKHAFLTFIFRYTRHLVSEKYVVLLVEKQQQNLNGSYLP